MRMGSKIVVAAVAVLAMTISPIVELDGETCGGFMYTIDRDITTSPNGCVALIDNLRVQRSLVVSAAVSQLLETSTTTIIVVNLLVIAGLVVHTALLYLGKLTQASAVCLGRRVWGGGRRAGVFF